MNHQLSSGSRVILHRGATIFLELGSFELHLLTALLMYVLFDLAVSASAWKKSVDIRKNGLEVLSESFLDSPTVS